MRKGLLGTFAGIDIIADERLPEFTPVIELINHVNVSPEFRAKTNAWYLEMFGEKRTMLMIAGKGSANPKTVALMREMVR